MNGTTRIEGSKNQNPFVHIAHVHYRHAVFKCVILCYLMGCTLTDYGDTLALARLSGTDDPRALITCNLCLVTSLQLVSIILQHVLCACVSHSNRLPWWYCVYCALLSYVTILTLHQVCLLKLTRKDNKKTALPRK